jgi:hydrogenase maturation protease
MGNNFSGDFHVIPSSTLQKILIIGIGNEYRSDDGVGIEVARTIREKHFPGVAVREESGDAAAIMEAWQGYENVILVDAISSGAEPGTIVVLDGNKKIAPSYQFHCSTHAFGVGEAIALAKAMNTLPTKLLIYGIEGAEFSTRKSLSRVVQKAVPSLVALFTREVKSVRR